MPEDQQQPQCASWFTPSAPGDLPLPVRCALAAGHKPEHRTAPTDSGKATYYWTDRAADPTAPTEPAMIISGPDHYREACRLLHALRLYRDAVNRGDVDLLWPYPVFTFEKIARMAELHTALATAAALGTLDAVEGPCGRDTLGRYSVTDGTAWADATGTGAPDVAP